MAVGASTLQHQSHHAGGTSSQVFNIGSVTDGDQFIVFASFGGGAALRTMSSLGTNFTTSKNREIGQDGAASSPFIRGALFQVVASATEASATMTVNLSGVVARVSLVVHKVGANASTADFTNGKIHLETTDTTPAGTLDTTPAAGSRLSSGIGWYNPASGSSVAPGSGWTELHESINSSEDVQTQSQEVAGSNGTTFDFTITLSGGSASQQVLWCVEIEEDVTGFTLTADSGSFALAGTAADLRRAANIAGESASFALTGAVAALSRGLGLDAESGVFALTGTAADLMAGAGLVAESGVFALTGSAVELVRTLLMAGESGSYAKLGTAAGLLRSVLLDAESATFVLTGTAATLDYAASAVLTAETGVFVLTGAVADLNHGLYMLAEAGAIVMTGNSVDLTHGVDAVLVAESGVFVLTGAAAALVTSGALAAESGSFVLTGAAAELVRSVLMTGESGVFVVSGSQADLLWSLLISADTGGFSLAGSAVVLDYSGAIIIGVAPRIQSQDSGRSISSATPSRSITL